MKKHILTLSAGLAVSILTTIEARAEMLTYTFQDTSFSNGYILEGYFEFDAASEEFGAHRFFVTDIEPLPTYELGMAWQSDNGLYTTYESFSAGHFSFDQSAGFGSYLMEFDVDMASLLSEGPGGLVSLGYSASIVNSMLGLGDIRYYAADTMGSLVVSEVSAVPVPAAVWLFGSGLIGLIGVARRRKATNEI